MMLKLLVQNKSEVRILYSTCLKLLVQKVQVKIWVNLLTIRKQEANLYNLSSHTDLQLDQIHLLIQIPAWILVKTKI